MPENDSSANDGAANTGAANTGAANTGAANTGAANDNNTATAESGTPEPQQGRTASRRDFLVGAGGAGVAAAVAVLATRTLSGSRAARGATSPGYAGFRPVTLTASASSPTDADWTALKNHLSTHTLYRPGQSGYTTAKQLFEPRFDGLTPAGVAYCRTPADVATCLSFVTRFSMPVRARSGGHSYAGWSSVTGGLIIDVSDMNTFSKGSGSVTVGSGIDLIHFYESLAAIGQAVPGGSCPTVGIAGLALGGGVGVLSRIHGLTSDHMLSTQVVTADGSVLTCDPGSHSDLYWASRGGGGGNFGVTTSFTFRTQPLSQLWLFFLTWPWSKAAKVVSAWQSWGPHGPDALWSNMHLSAPFTAGSPAISVGGTFVGTAADLGPLFHDLYRSVGSDPSSAFAKEQSYLSVMLVEAGCSTIPINACHTGTGGQLPRVPSYAKSDFFTKPLDAAGISAMIAGIEKIPGIKGTAGGAGTIALDACGGQMNAVAPTDTAFVHRDALYLAQYSTVWTSPGTTSGVNNQHDWLRSYYNTLHPHASGQAYQNYVDPDLTDWETAYYGVNYPQLQKVKKTYDPNNLFTFPQSIRPA
jgi:FAD/FMN-containing dehydrogenase